MASTFIALRHRSHRVHLKSNQTLFNFSRLYSSSNDDNDGKKSGKLSSFSSYFSQINPKSQQSVDGIRKKLSGHHHNPSDAPLQSHSFQNFKLSNALSTNPNPNPSLLRGNNFQLSYIKESLQHIQTNKGNLGDSNNNAKNQSSWNNYRGSFMKSGVGNTSKSRVFGGSLDSLPSGTFGKELSGAKDESSKFELAKPYSHAELGKKLKELRPDLSQIKKKNKDGEEEEGGWFSFSELQGRLGKLREIEDEKEKEKSTKQMDGKAFRELRLGLKTIQSSKDEKSKGALKMDTSSEAGLMQSLPQPPKEHLIEKYFHPDNMSAAEKLKIELKKVRDEFKMSESDCGSTRVQIAQLTTEIHHLSSVLHKKDKHSRRGLQAKVQQRKKLLKYLKRTDLDDYYFVLSKLGLRDNLDDKYAF